METGNEIQLRWECGTAVQRQGWFKHASKTGPKKKKRGGLTHEGF